jgi:hypothetical protein
MSKQTPKPPTSWQLEKSVALWQQIQHAQQQDEMLESDEVSGMIRPLEGSPENIPDPHVLLERLIDAAVWADRRVDEADNMRARAIARKARYQRRSDRYRNDIKQLMEVLAVAAWEGEEGTASTAKGRSSVLVTDIDKLEAARPELVKVETIKTPDKVAIRDAIKALKPDETLEGAEMSNPEPILRITAF